MDLTTPTSTPTQADLARLCARACQAAYSGPHTIESDLAHCNIVFDPGAGVVVVAFRGTANIRDWITDADAHKVKEDVGRGEIHQGFYRAFSSIVLQILAHDLVQQREHPIIITGHSLGGALAVECARIFSIHNIPFQNLITFGQPRVGDKSYAAFSQSQFGDRHIRFTNRADIVPWVPWLRGTYVHSGTEKYFAPGWFKPFENPSIWTKLFDNGIELFMEWQRGKFAALVDHAIEQYIERTKFL